MNIRLIASDIDGTLLPHGGKLSQASRQAVTACRERGIPFALSSGRWFPMAREIALALGQQGSDFMLTANGGLVVTVDGDVVMETLMAPEDAEKAFCVVRDTDALLMSTVRSTLYVLNYSSLGPVKPGEYGVWGGARYRCVACDAAQFAREALEHAYKFEVYCDNPTTIQSLREKLCEAGLDVSCAFPINLEIMSPGTGKGVALTRLAEHLGISREEIMAFGDNTNDLQMLKASGWPVAMENGADALKSVARFIAPKSQDDGVARVLQKYVLGE